MRLLETIKVENGEFQNLDFHQWRIDWSRKRLGFKDILKLSLPTPPKDEVFRCRIIYYKKIEKIEFIPYKKRELKRFSLAFSENIDYSLKYENRDVFDSLKREFLNGNDEIVVVKNGLITDISIANITFFDGEKWITPKTPLLQGTVRERFLREKKIFTADIKVEDIWRFKKLGLINAMFGFQIVDGNISDIIS